MFEHTGKSYQDKAAQYADTIDEKPLNIYFERHAFISLLPELNQKNVLDAGCVWLANGTAPEIASSG